MNEKIAKRLRLRSERGQTIIIAVLVIGIFLLGFVGLAVDFSGLWFKRQAAQAAADAACQAGAMNMLLAAQGVGTTTAGFTPGTNFNCATASWPDPAHQPTPCWYANANGYSGTGLVANTESNAVAVTFPGAIPGVTTPPSSIAGSYPFIQVEVTDRARVFFPSLFTGNNTQDVKAAARCGLVLTTAPIPIIVLHPTMSRSFTVSGSSSLRVFGGPTQSIQVNSSDTTQATYISGSAFVDLTQGGPAHTGSDLGTWGGPSTQPSGFLDPAGSTVDWMYRHFPISDPFATVPVPDPTGMPSRSGPVDTAVNYDPSVTDTTHDPLCPVLPAYGNCVRYYPGYYPTGITVRNENALFVPGVYYLDGDLQVVTNSSVRPSTMAGDGSGGTMFYFHGTSGLNVTGASGSGNFSPGGTLLPFPVSLVQCPPPNGAPPDPPLTGPLNGNIFLGPCSGTYGTPNADYRGMLFFHDRNAVPSGTGRNAMYGGGGLLVAGNSYFHQNSGYGGILDLQGGTSSDTRILGNIVVDQLTTLGNSGIDMQLNPNAVYSILTVQLLQ